MGLDMYFKARIYSNIPTEFKGFPVSHLTVDLAYFRKHPDLHGYIVKTFADNVDNCQEIELDKSDIQNILDAVNNNDLPKTEGFFFGSSLEEDIPPTVFALNNMLKFLDDNDQAYVIYQASW